jgi:type I restriction enzyme S subunit
MFQTLPKDGGLSSLGTIPDDWEIVTFKDVCEVRQGLQIAISKRYKNYKNGRFIYITIEYLNNLNNQNLLEYIDSPGARVICKHNDVLVARTGATGKIITGVEGVFHNNFFLVDYNRKEVDINYLVHYLKFEPVQKEIKFRAGTTTIPDLNHGDFYSLTFIKPKILEQQKIAEILDAIDKAIALTDTHITKLKKAKAGLLHDLLTRGIDDHGELRDYTRNPELFKRSPLGIIPKDWDVEPLHKHTLSSAFGPRFSSSLYADDGNVATLRTTDMDEEGNLDLSTMPLAHLNLELFNLHILEVGDLLISRSGTCGITAVFPGFNIPVLPGAFLIRFRLKESVKAEFIRRYFNYELGRARVLNEAEGGVQKNLRGSTLLKLLIPIPPKQEQDAIIHRLRCYESKIITRKIYLEKLKLLKQGLMSDLLTGRVRVKI